MATDTDSALRMLSLRTRPGSPFLTYVAIKEHKNKPGTSVSHGSSLFVSGIPLKFDEDAVAAVFACFGSVQQAVLHHNKRSGIVLFEEEDAAKSALTAAKNRSLVEWALPESDAPTGVKAWVRHHKSLRPGNKVLQKQLDDWIANYEEAKEREQQEKTAAMAGDGWTVVVRSKGRAKTTESGAVSTRSGGGLAAAAAAKAKSKQEVENKFYRFQQRENGEVLMELRHQFDQDRKRIAELRHSRNFKPY